MITSSFSIVDSIESMGGSYHYISNPNDNFSLTFIGERIYNIKDGIIPALYGRLLLCWDDGIHSFYIIIKPNRLIKVDGNDYTLCKFLCDKYHMISELDDMETIKLFAYL